MIVMMDRNEESNSGKIQYVPGTKGKPSRIVNLVTKVFHIIFLTIILVIFFVTIVSILLNFNRTVIMRNYWEAISDDLTFSHNGRYIACSDYQNFYMWEVGSGRMLFREKTGQEYHSRNPRNYLNERIIFSPEDRYLLIDNPGTKLFKIMEEPGHPVKPLTLSDNSFGLYGFSPDGKYIFGTQGEKEYLDLLLFDLASFPYSRLAMRLREKNNPMYQRIMSFLSKETHDIINGIETGQDPGRSRKQKIAAGLNSILDNREFYDIKVFEKIELTQQGKNLLNKGLNNLKRQEIRKFNRLLFEDIFPDLLVKTKKVVLSDLQNETLIKPPFDYQKLKRNPPPGLLGKYVNSGFIIMFDVQKDKEKNIISDKAHIELYDLMTDQPAKILEMKLLKYGTNTNIPEIHIKQQKILAIYQDCVRITDIETGKTKTIYIPDNLTREEHSFCFSDNGECFAYEVSIKRNVFNHYERPLTVKVFSVDKGEMIGEVKLESNRNIESISLHPQRKILAVAYRKRVTYFGETKGKIIIYNYRTGGEVKRIEMEKDDKSSAGDQ